MEEMKILSGLEVVPSLLFGTVHLPTLAVLNLSKNWGKPSYLYFLCSEFTCKGCQSIKEMKSSIVLIEKKMSSQI